MQLNKYVVMCQVLFGVVVKINKKSKSADFEEMHNTGLFRKGKKVLIPTGKIHNNVTAIRGGVHRLTWEDRDD